LAVRALLLDFFIFVEILVYWAFVLVVMLPLSFLDRRLRTRLVVPLDHLTRWIARL
jgi:hypothetical protein